MTRALRRSCRHFFFRPGLLLLLAFPALGLAQPALAKNTAPADDKVLDFIADWQGDDGQWVDPMTFARIDPAKVKAEDDRRHGRPQAPANEPAPPPATGAPAATFSAGTAR